MLRAMESVPPVHQRVLVVGVDGSAGAAHAVRWAALEAAATGACVRLVSVWDVPGGVWPAPPGGYVTSEEIAEGAHRIAQRAEHDVGRVAGGPPVPTEIRAVRGAPADELLPPAAMPTSSWWARVAMAASPGSRSARSHGRAPTAARCRWR